MRIQILGVGGTFMGGLAQLARQMGHEVTGVDQHLYPPMSEQLRQAGIPVVEGYREAHLDPGADLYIVGNALSRGNPMVEALLRSRRPYTSGPQWLGEQLLRGRRTLAVAGTHGKTTTSSLLTWILDQAGLEPGFLIGGVPENFACTARLGAADAPFVIEADEYDMAFFDKRSKFLHYRPDLLVLNNLEFDHADIFDDLAAIQRQFHHLLRTIPDDGLVWVNEDDAHLQQVLEMGCWTPRQTFGMEADRTPDWMAHLEARDGSRFVLHHGQRHWSVSWSMTGRHNVSNAVAAVACAHACGVPVEQAVRALASFDGVRRRQTRLMETPVTVYEDFAHHPTAIRMTLEGVRARYPDRRLLAVLEPRSNSMRAGAHTPQIAPALVAADRVWLYTPPGVDWDPVQVIAALHQPGSHAALPDGLIEDLLASVRPGDVLLFMSNGSFDAIPARFVQALTERGLCHSGR